MDCGFTDAMRSLGEKTANFFESHPEDTYETADKSENNLSKITSDTEDSITDTAKLAEESLKNEAENIKDNIEETRKGMSEEIVEGSEESDYKFIDTIPPTCDEAIKEIREEILETGKDME